MLYDDKKFIGAKIQEYRKKRKLTQAQLAEKIGLTDKHIGRIEAGTFFPACNKFMNILDILNIDIEEFGVNIKSDSSPNRKKAVELLYKTPECDIDAILPILEAALKSFKRITNK